MNQSQVIKKEIIELINSGLTNKATIYTQVVDKLNVKRPTVRRCARDLIKDLENTLQVLK